MRTYIKVIGLYGYLAHDNFKAIREIEYIAEYIRTKDIEIDITFDRVYLRGHNVFKLQRAYDEIESYLESLRKGNYNITIIKELV